MEKLKDFIDNYLRINKEMTLVIFTIEHDNKKHIDEFLKNLSKILIFDNYNISRKGSQFSILSTAILTVKGKYTAEGINKYITLLFNRMTEKEKENILLLHKDIYVDDVTVTHPLAQMQISHSTTVVKKHLELTNVL